MLNKLFAFSFSFWGLPQIFFRKRENINKLLINYFSLEEQKLLIVYLSTLTKESKNWSDYGWFFKVGGKWCHHNDLVTISGNIYWALTALSLLCCTHTQIKFLVLWEFFWKTDTQLLSKILLLKWTDGAPGWRSC